MVIYFKFTRPIICLSFLLRSFSQAHFYCSLGVLFSLCFLPFWPRWLFALTSAFLWRAIIAQQTTRLISFYLFGIFCFRFCWFLPGFFVLFCGLFVCLSGWGESERLKRGERKARRGGCKRTNWWTGLLEHHERTSSNQETISTQTNRGRLCDWTAKSRRMKTGQLR